MLLMLMSLLLMLLLQQLLLKARVCKHCLARRLHMQQTPHSFQQAQHAPLTLAMHACKIKHMACKGNIMHTIRTGYVGRD